MLPRRPKHDILTDTEKAQKQADKEHLDELDRHVDDVLRKRDMVKRTLRGLLTFVKTRARPFLPDFIVRGLTVPNSNRCINSDLRIPCCVLGCCNRHISSKDHQLS